MSKRIIPVFYSADENYMPYLAVALSAVKAHKSKDCEYRIHVLYSGVLNGAATKVKEMEEEGFSIFFEDVGEKMDAFSDCMHCRDYYTSAIYYRLLIPELFPSYDKVLYMDCDTVVLEDIARLYAVDIGENYIGAVADQAVAAVPEFGAYTKNALGIEAERYFNSGVLIMNLKKLREIGFYHLFSRVLRSYPFTIAPDQDVLNFICKGNTYYLEDGWNTMPIGGREGNQPKLIHYNLALKPWHYDGILYEEYFWEYASRTPFLAYMQQVKKDYTPDKVKKDEEGGAKLIAMAKAEAENPCNFLRSMQK